MADLPRKTPSRRTFQAWRDDRDRTAQKYALWDAGQRIPPLEWEPGKPCSIWMKCPCGEIFDSHDPAGSYIHRVHIYRQPASRNH